jgi:trans-aconitate methyltransferase
MHFRKERALHLLLLMCQVLSKLSDKSWLAVHKPGSAEASLHNWLEQLSDMAGKIRSAPLLESARLDDDAWLEHAASSTPP